MLLNYNEIEGTDVIAIDTFDDDTNIEDLINACKSKFEKEKNRGIIRKCEFEDNEWILHNGVKSFIIKFKLDEVTYQSFHSPIPYKTFMDAYKSYIVGLLRTKSIPGLRRVSNNIYNILVDSKFLNLNYVDCIIERAIKTTDNLIGEFEKALDFFKLIPSQEISEFIDEVSDYIKHSDLKSKLNINGLNRRDMPDYYSTLLFDKIIEDWWKSEIAIEERIYFYPIYLWWKITSVLPLRPTEFSLIPYKCIQKENGEFYITVRRSNLKGNKSRLKYSKVKTIHYDINKDYKKVTYKINQEIYELLKTYQEISSVDEFKNKFCEENDVLLNRTMHRHYTYLYTGTGKGKGGIDENYQIFQTCTLESLLGAFYRRIINEKYGLKLRDYKIDDQELYSVKSIELKEISKLTLGDTRHIALINMCLSDINPVLIRDFVNHRNINTTYHYIENTKEFVKCFTNMQYRKLKRNMASSTFDLQFDSDVNVDILLNKSKKYVNVDNGKCYSKNFIKGSIKDCISSDLEIGSCRGCDFFVRDTALSNDEISLILKECDHKLEKESNFLVSELRRFVFENKSSTKEGMDVSIMRLKTAIMQHRKVVESLILEEQNGM